MKWRRTRRRVRGVGVSAFGFAGSLSWEPGKDERDVVRNLNVDLAPTAHSPPHSIAILAVGSITGVAGGSRRRVATAHLMPLNLACDNRIPYGPDGARNKSGAELEAPAEQVWEVRAGKIARLENKPA
jgi:hypothetical protein